MALPVRPPSKGAESDGGVRGWCRCCESRAGDQSWLLRMVILAAALVVTLQTICEAADEGDGGLPLLTKSPASWPRRSAIATGSVGERSRGEDAAVERHERTMVVGDGNIEVTAPRRWRRCCRCSSRSARRERDAGELEMFRNAKKSCDDCQAPPCA